MTKSELRKARKAAHAAGLPLSGELSLDRDQNTNMEFSPEFHANGRPNISRARALERWARENYESEGAGDY